MCESIQALPWQNFPVATAEEVRAPSAKHTFYATPSIKEKTGRIFNNAMFLIPGVALLKPAFGFIPGYIAATSYLTGKVSLALGGLSMMQMPIVAAIAAMAPKILLTLALIVIARKVLAVVVNHFVYIAVLMTYSHRCDAERVLQFKQLTNDGYECRRIKLNLSGINYDAFVVGKKENMDNGQWALAAGGNGWIGEQTLSILADRFSPLGLNLVYVNGPGVARSSGFPTSYSIGAGQEAGMQFLEKSVKAKKILLYGTSLGGGAQAEAICDHDFKKDVKYMVWSDRSFDKLSNAASAMVTRLVKPLFFLLGIELDGLAGARRLRELNITHIVTQNSREANEQFQLPLDTSPSSKGTDGVIPNSASLFYGLRVAGFNDADRLKCYGSSRVRHNDDLPSKIRKAVEADIRTFLQD